MKIMTPKLLKDLATYVIIIVGFLPIILMLFYAFVPPHVALIEEPQKTFMKNLALSSLLIGLAIGTILGVFSHYLTQR